MAIWEGYEDHEEADPMIELELLGANGDVVVMTDARGQRYSIVVDDALRAAVRRDRPAALPQPADSPAPSPQLRPRDLQALMRAGASAAEVASSTGLDIAHVRRFEGPVLAERRWAVEQAQAHRVGWEKDSPVLGELVIDRLATRGVDPASLEWDALREGREPWQVTLTFVQGAEEKQARWVLDVQARSITALDDEARWLTEAAAGGRKPAIFDQDSQATGASARNAEDAEDKEPEPAPSGPALPDPASLPEAQNSTEALLADLASSRGQRQEVESPEVEELSTPVLGEAKVVSMSERRRALANSHPSGPRLGASSPSAPSPSGADAASQASAHEAITSPTARVEDTGVQKALPQMPPVAAHRPKRRPRRSVPSWDEIVFGARPE